MDKSYNQLPLKELIRKNRIVLKDAASFERALKKVNEINNLDLKVEDFIF